MVERWFTSDQHYCHANIIKFCNRPFGNVWEMNEALIENHNAVVKPDDHIYMLGDFCFRGNKGKAIEILKRLNGKKFLIRGNHDQVACKEEVAPYFEWIKDYYELSVPDISAPRKEQKIVLMHYAMRVWNKSHWGTYHLYGHSHGSLPDDPTSRSFDVGVDCHDYRPICYDEVKVIMDQKQFKPIDRDQ